MTNIIKGISVVAATSAVVYAIRRKKSKLYIMDEKYRYFIRASEKSK